MAIGSGPISIIFENPATTTSTRNDKSDIRPRREHQKSRNGCLNCKRQRRKCDEAHPQCSLCDRSGRRCEYPNDTPTTNNAVLKPGALDMSPQAALPHAYASLPTYRLELLTHFIAPSSAAWIGSPSSQLTMQSHAVNLSLHAPYLLHTILAFSATHLSYLHPGNQKYRLAAVLHYNLSLGHYRERLCRGLDEGDADTVFTAAILHTMLAFVHESRRARGSEGEGEGKFCSAWLRSFQGTQILLERPELRSALEKGIWTDMLNESNVLAPIGPFDPLERSADDQTTFAHITALESSISHLPPRHRDGLLVPARMLRILIPPAEAEPTKLTGTELTKGPPEPMSPFIHFINHLPPAFGYLLEASQPEALVILGTWTALLTRVDVWWTNEASVSETRRICGSLRRVGVGRLEEQVRWLEGFCDG